MKTKYQAGKYAIKYKGRGLVFADLTASQVKALFEIDKNGFMEFESIQLCQDSNNL